MARPSGKGERLEALGRICAPGQILHIAQVAQQLGTSEATLRRDLTGGAGDLVCLGGYVMRAVEAAEGYSLHRAEGSDPELKEALGRAASALVDPEDAIFIDCGSTLVHLARHLPQRAGVTVVTQALNIAQEVSRLDGVRLVLLGGHYHGETASFSGAQGLQMLDELSLTKGFFSAAGVDQQRGVSSFHFYERPTKRAALACCRQKFLVCDASKLGKLRPAHYARLDEFDQWIGAPAKMDA